MQRRKFLKSALIGGGIALSGCIEPDEKPNSTNNQTQPKNTPTINPPEGSIPIDTTVPTQYGSIRVTDFLVQQSVEIMGAVHRRVRNNEDEQYLILEFYVGNADGSPSNLADRLKNILRLQTRNETVEPINQDATLNLRREDYTTIVFPVQRQLQNFGAINVTYETEQNSHNWNIKELATTTGYINYLRNPPRFDVTEVQLREENADNDSVPLDVTVTETTSNNFGRTENFNVKIGSTALSSSPVYSFEVGSGQSVQRTFDVKLYKDSGVERIRVNWGKDSITKQYNHN